MHHQGGPSGSAQPEASAAGRVPPPPSMGVGYRIFSVVMSLVSLACAVVVGWGVSSVPDHLDPLRWIGWGFAGLFLIGPVAMTTVAVVAFRMRPGEELCWAPVQPGQPWQVSFVAQRSSYHGLWMNYDVEYLGDDHGCRQLCCSIEVDVEGQLAERRVVTTAWPNRCGRSDFAVGVRGGELPKGTERAIREVHCGVSSRGRMRLSGQESPLRFQALSLLHKIDVDPGRSVTVRGMLYPPNFSCQQLRAHGFIALP